MVSEARVLIPETTFVGVESRVLIPETTFVDVESRVLIPETTFVGVESRLRFPESKESTSGTKKAKGKGTSEKGAQNERDVVTSEEDEIKDVTLDIDKTVASEIQIDEAHHTLKKDDPVDRAGPKVEQGNPENEKEDETNEKTKLIIRHNNTHEFLDITSMVESITQLSQTISQVLISVWLRLAALRENLITSMDESISQNYRAIFGILDDGDLRTKNVHAIMLISFAVMQIYSEEIYPTQLRTLGAGVAIVVGRIGNIVLPLVGEGMMETRRLR
nr:organic cation/carnitine transporter 7 [Tanacetum cinerariifolium]